MEAVPPAAAPRTPSVSFSDSFSSRKKIFLAGLIAYFALLFLLMTYFFRRPAHRFRRSRRVRATTVHTTSIITTTVVSATAAALDKLLPFFVYSAADHDKKLECAVCLTEFKDGEKGRLLPRCFHSFHMECVDMWLHSHSTCPLCRAAVNPEFPYSVV